MDGSQWSSLYLVLSDPSFYRLQVGDLGGSPFASLPGDPASYITEGGNTITIGRWWVDPQRTVFTLNVWDNAIPSWPCVGMDMTASTENAYWRWVHPGSVAMELDYLHRLALTKRSNSAQRIILDPELGRITVNGAQVVTTANASAQLSSQFVSRRKEGLNLALTGGILRTTANQPPQIILGRFNETDSSDGVDHTQGVLIVGNGDGSTTADGRRNGLRILDDGTVLIWPRDDLPMAWEFRKGPTP
jgi:hypothetical protein